MNMKILLGAFIGLSLLLGGLVVVTLGTEIQPGTRTTQPSTCPTVDPVRARPNF